VSIVSDANNRNHDRNRNLQTSTASSSEFYISCRELFEWIQGWERVSCSSRVLSGDRCSNGGGSFKVQTSIDRASEFWMSCIPFISVDSRLRKSELQ